MTDYIGQVADLLKKGEKVIFYTLGTDTFLNIKELKFRFGMLPSALCDGDPNKQGRAWRGLEGVAVLSSDEVIEKFPKAYWLISSLHYRYQIIGYLTEERGIAPERIVNYVPVRKFRSCLHLHQSIEYDRTGELTFCCGVACPKVAPGKPQTAAAALRVLRDDLLKAIEEDHIPPDSRCAACDLIKEDYYPTEPKELYFNYFGNSVCNYRCSYCVVSHAGKLKEDAGRDTVHDLTAALRQENMLEDDYNLDLVTAGDPTLYPKRKEVYQEFDGNRMGFVTNGFLYDPDLVEMMNRKKVYIITSIDAGTPGIYRQIKGVDGFDRVRQNLKKYAQAPLGIVVLKYIFMPGINDTPEEVDGFIDFCAETNASYAIAVVDFYSVSKITERTGEMIRRLMTGLSEKDILCILHTANCTKAYGDKLRMLAIPAKNGEK